MIVGRRPSGTFPISSAIAKDVASWNESPARSVPSGRNARPTDTATMAISHATRRTSRSRGLSSTPVRCDSAAIRPSSVRIPVATATPVASPTVHVAPVKSMFGDSRSDRPRSGCAGLPRHGHRLPGDRGHVDLDGAGQHADVGGDAVALLDHHDVARHDEPGVDRLAPPVAKHRGLGRQVLGERLDGSLRLVLLNEREHRVQEDDRDHRAPTMTTPVPNASAAAAHSSRARGWVS